MKFSKEKGNGVVVWSELERCWHRRCGYYKSDYYAVALRYEKGMDLAPVVIAKGENLLARRIKNTCCRVRSSHCENSGSFIVCTWSSWKSIPFDFYQVVAEILAQVYKTHAYYTKIKSS